MKKIIYWLPRIFSIILTSFWFVFVFWSHGLSRQSFIESGVWVILLIMTILAWRRQKTGQLGFIIFGILYIILTWGKFPVRNYLLISGPLLFIGLLYLIGDNLKLPIQIKLPAKLHKIAEEAKKDDDSDGSII